MTRKKYEDDDGRRIADMSGIDLHSPGGVSEAPQRNRAADTETETGIPGQPPFTRRETLRIMFVTLGWSLLIGLVFIAAIGLFILFCTKVWFR